MNQVISDLFPSAIGVALSPVPIIAVILMLATPKARSTGLAFAVGWITGLVVVGVVVLIAAGGSDQPDSAASTGASGLQLLFGLAFFALAAKQWRTRPKPGEPGEMPKWMATIDTFAPGKCFVMGALLAGVNPKNLILTAAAATTIAQAGLDTTDSAIALGIFVLVASITVVGPVVFYLLATEKAAAPLASIKTFMSDNVAVISIVIFLVLGANLIGTGYAGLTA